MDWKALVPILLDVAGTAVGAPWIGRVSHALAAAGSLESLRERSTAEGKKAAGGAPGFSDYLATALGVGSNVPGMFPAGAVTKAGELGQKAPGALGIGLTDKPIYGQESRWLRSGLGQSDPLFDLLNRRWR